MFLVYFMGECKYNLSILGVSEGELCRKQRFFFVPVLLEAGNGVSCQILFREDVLQYFSQIIRFKYMSIRPFCVSLPGFQEY